MPWPPATPTPARPSVAEPRGLGKAGTAQSEVTALFKQGLALHQQGQLAQAQAIYEQVLAEQPRHFDALHLLGVLAAQSKNHKLAAELIGKAIEIYPNSALAHYNLGVALRELQRVEEAVASYDRAIAIKPDYALAYYNRGNALQKLQRTQEALASYDRAIAIKPDYAEAYGNRGNALETLKRTEEALASYERALEIRPDYAEAHNNRGNVLQELKRGEEALASYDRAIAVRPDYAEAYGNRGATLIELRRVAQGLASCERALEIRPDYAEAHWNKSIALLLTGEFRQGWALYEWRWKREDAIKPKQTLTQPLWLGAQDIANKTLFVYAEQGLGDTIQFCRYAKLVKTLGARVLLAVPKTLMGLLSRLDGVDALLEEGRPLPAFDYHCPLMSMPLAFKTELHSIPSPTPYLFAADDKREAWAQTLGAKTKPRVGLVWSGSVMHKKDRNRSLRLQEILPHLPASCEYVSLQKEVRAADQEVLARSCVRHYGERLGDFADTAALCDLMDVVVSVDTSTAHLAGAIGKTTWVLLPDAPDWRWLLDRADSPWYAAIKLYRQGADRQWRPVLERLAHDLKQLSCAS